MRGIYIGDRREDRGTGRHTGVRVLLVVLLIVSVGILCNAQVTGADSDGTAAAHRPLSVSVSGGYGFPFLYSAQYLYRSGVAAEASFGFTPESIPILTGSLTVENAFLALEKTSRWRTT